MKLGNGPKIALISIGLIAVQSAVIWMSYTYGNNDGVMKGRIGYMKTPITSGTITINDKLQPEFKPFGNAPYFDKTGPWNSERNRNFFEHQIKTQMGTYQFGKWVRTSVASVKCTPTQTKNVWSCPFRVLSDPYVRQNNVEVNPETGEWVATRGN
jgi:hypothetical protein